MARNRVEVQKGDAFSRRCDRGSWLIGLREYAQRRPSRADEGSHATFFMSRDVV